MALTTMGKVSVLEKLLWGEHTCLFLSYQIPSTLGTRGEKLKTWGESILFLHAPIHELHPFDLIHLFYSLKSFQVNKCTHFQTRYLCLCEPCPIFLTL